MNSSQIQVLIMILVILLITSIFFVFLFYLTEKKKKKNKTIKKEEMVNIQNEDKKYPDDFNIGNKTAQDFIPFDDIDSSMICLPNGMYRMVVEVGSINYYLKTGKEQETIEGMFRNAISSWDFPYMFYTQTREIDNEQIINNLERDVNLYTSKFPNLLRYGKEYIEAMKRMDKEAGNNLTKKHFIIISCNDASTIKSNKTEDDKREYAFDKLSLAVQKVYEGLSPLGIQVHCLNNEELVDLLLIAINKDEVVKNKRISEFMSFVVNGDERLSKKPIEEKLPLLFEGFENQIKAQILSYHDYSSSDFVKAQHLLNKLEEIKEEIITKEVPDENDYFDLTM